jgi:hypothetical protein
VDTYSIDLAAVRVPRAKRFTWLLIQFAILVPLYFFVLLASQWLFHLHRETDRVGMIIQSVIFGFCMSLLSSFRKGAQYQIEVDEEAIRTKNFSSNNWLSSRAIRRGEVRTLIERRNGLLVSRHNRVGTFFWGGVWIPKQLADYEYLKRMVSSWRVLPAA